MCLEPPEMLVVFSSDRLIEPLSNSIDIFIKQSLSFQAVRAQNTAEVLNTMMQLENSGSDTVLAALVVESLHYHKA